MTKDKSVRALYSLSMAVLLSLALGACASSSSSGVDAIALLEKINEDYDKSPNLWLKGQMALSGVPVNIWFEATVKERDSLKIALNGPFGIAVGLLGSTPEEFTFLDFRMGTAYKGVPDRHTMYRASSIGLSYDEIVALMRAEVPNIPSRSELESGSVKTVQSNGKVEFQVQNGDEVESFLVDAEKFVVLEYKRDRIGGEELATELRVIYEDFFLKVNGRLFPEKATMLADGGSVKLTVTFDLVKDKLPKGSNCKVDVPASMKVERL